MERTPAWVYAVSLGAGVVGVFLPAIAPELVSRWEGARWQFVLAALLAVLAHALLHLVFPRSKLAPGALVAAGALAWMLLLQPALGWCAFAANLAASGPDFFEARR